MGLGADIQVAADAGLAAGHLFVSRGFNQFQSAAQGKALVSFAADGVSLTLAGRDGLWATPITGAFGGVAAEGPARASLVFALAEAMDAWVRREAGLRRCVVRLAPDCFADPNAAALETALHGLGWRLDQVDLNHHLPAAALADFPAALSETKAKELRRLIRSGAVYGPVDPAQGEAAYQVIADNRRAQGHPMTMTWPQVKALAEAFPDRVSFHAVERDGEALAAAICLGLTPAYRYVFYWGERPQTRKESPVTLLAAGLAADSLAAGVATLDIGTSTDASRPNPGLIAFKESLGCRASGKRAYVLDLA